MEQGLITFKKHKLIELLPQNYDDAGISVLIHTWWAGVGALQGEKHEYLTLMLVSWEFSLVFLLFSKKKLPIGFPVRSLWPCQKNSVVLHCHFLMPLLKFLPCTAANVRECQRAQFPEMLRGSQGYLRARTIIFPATFTQIFPPHTQLSLAFAAVQGKNFCSVTRR